MNMHHVPTAEAEPMPSMEEFRVATCVSNILSLIDEAIALRHRSDTADLMLFEQEALHIANAKLSNLVADLYAAEHKAEH